MYTLTSTYVAGVDTRCPPPRTLPLRLARSLATDREQSNLALCARECRETTAARAVTQPHVDALEGDPPRGADAAAAAAVHSGMKRRHAHLIAPPRYRGHTSLLHTGAPAPPHQRSPGANEPHRRVHRSIAVFTGPRAAERRNCAPPGRGKTPGATHPIPSQPRPPAAGTTAPKQTQPCLRRRCGCCPPASPA